MSNEPDETHTFTDADVAMWLDVAVPAVPGQSNSADHMIVTPTIGTDDDVLIVTFEGKRKVLRVRQAMGLSEPPPAAPVSVSWGNQPEPVGPEDERKILAIYDRFDRRSFPE